MVSLNPGNNMMGGVRPWSVLLVMVFTMSSLVHVCLQAQDDSRRKEQINDVNTLVQDILSGNNPDKIARFTRFTKQELSDVPNEKVLKIYKKYRSELLTDSYDYEKTPSRGELSDTEGMCKLMYSTNAEGTYKLLDKDVHRINVIDFHEIKNGWLRMQYISVSNCAGHIFKALIGKYGPEKLVELSQRLMKQDREQLLVILLLTRYHANPYRGDLTSKERLKFIEVYSKLFQNKKIQISDTLKKTLVSINSLRSRLLVHIRLTYNRLNSNERKKADPILEKYGIWEVMMERMEEK